MTKRLTLQEVSQLALDRGGILISESFTSVKDVLTWRCEKSHLFTRSIFDVKYMGYWCPTCKGRHSDQDYVAWASKINATFLSVEKQGSIKKLRLKCSNNHIWLASPSHIKSGSGCPECSGRKKLSLTSCRDYAASRGGECLSLEYKNANSLLEWRCSERHEWKAKFGPMRHSDTWCPKCANASSRRWSIEDATSLASANNGMFLSKEFKNRGDKYDWSCKNGHNFTMEFDSVLKGRWCPKCKFKKESRVREIVESITGHKFPQKSPQWLKNTKTGGRLKFDAFNEILGIAVEYHGEFHYRPNPWDNSLREIKFRDSLKKRLAKKNKVKLIIVPYTVKDVESFLKKRLSTCLRYFR